MSTDLFRAARDELLQGREDYEAARRFRWPQPATFNWAVDWFDTLPAEREALRVLFEDGRAESRTFGELTARSAQVADWLRANGIVRGDRVLVMLGNVVPLWEVFLGCIKLGAVVIPTSTLVAGDDLADRLDRGAVRAVVAAPDLVDRFVPGDRLHVAVGAGDLPPGWRSYAEVDDAPPGFEPDGPTPADAALLLYFTSGTTAKPKLVEHTHISYPIGHLSTMYWLGLQPGDVHLNISSPGWAKHAWSSLFTPWNAEATVVALEYQRFDATRLFDVLAGQGITSLCAPPTVWRMLIQADLGSADVSLRKALSAGEPLNPEVIAAVERAWGVTIRDGYGQTETTALVGNSPGQAVKAGSMGRPLPGYEVVLVDADGNEADEGEVAVRLDPRPVGLMVGYRDDDERTAAVTAGGLYRTGDVAARDTDGYLTYVGRSDDVFKSSDYRISPFELESVLIEHPAVAEAAVVPSPDERRLSVPKAFVTLAAGQEPSDKLADDILRFAAGRLSPFKRVRRIEFAELPKTVSGKIRRNELRRAEADHVAEGGRRENEWWEEDLPRR